MYSTQSISGSAHLCCIMWLHGGHGSEHRALAFCIAHDIMAQNVGDAA